MTDPENGKHAQYAMAPVSADQVELTEKQRKKEKCLTIAAIVFFLIAVVFLVLFVVYFLEAKDCDDDVDGDDGGKRLHRETCTTPTCLQVAASVSEHLDRTVDPCQDFYQFACGHYNKNNPLTSENPNIGPTVKVNNDVTDAVKELLLQEGQGPPPIEAVQKVKTFFRACMDRDSVEEMGVTPFLNKIAALPSGVFPSVTKQQVNYDTWSLNDILAKAPRYTPDIFSTPQYDESNPLFPMTVSNNFKNSTRHVISFGQAVALNDSRTQFVEDRNSSTLRIYEQVYTALAVALGADETTAKRDAVDVFDLEFSLIRATVAKDKMKYQTMYKQMTLRQMKQSYPQLDWLTFLQGQFSPLRINLTDEEVVALLPLDYFDAAMPIIGNATSRTLLNFCMWKFLYYFNDYFPTTLRKQMLLGRLSDRSSNCVMSTIRYFPEVTGRLYVDAHFSHDTRKKLEDMIVDLKDAFKDIIRDTDWMSSETKQAAVDKVDKMAELIGYPDVLKNDTYLNDLLKEVNFTAGAGFENSLIMGKLLRKRTLLKLTKPVDRQEWIVSPALVNAFAYPLTNAIIFPAAFFRKPVFTSNNLDAMTYGAVGYVLGHEITHNFDTTGAVFDKDGQLSVWWKGDDYQQFEDRGRCMSDQYSEYNFNFTVAVVNVNGNLTLGENIADNGGLKEAYKAFQKMKAKKGSDVSRLPLLDYTSDQLFFISAAQLWCNNIAPTHLYYQLLTDVHSPNKYRVNGPMQNNEDFARAFDCKPGTYMNPEKKCHVW